MRVELLHHVLLAMPVGGEARAREFYQDLLGIPEVPKPAESARRGGCWFERGSLRVHLGVESDFRPARKAHPAFLVSDLESLTARLQSAGYECRSDREFPGYERTYVFDPFGNRLELLQPTASAS